MSERISRVQVKPEERRKREMEAIIPDPGELKQINQSELKEIIKKHRMYLQGQIGGARALLKYHNLKLK